ncbi:MAG: AAA family ATPase [Candidatus Glassbacteria bacterium]|nr:AAA family ATPase [Candidatus Glassbacteria bacterium]
MLPEYLKYWGLEKAPFSLTPDPDMLYMSKQHQEGLIRLQYAVISNKGGALLVSENAGDGKTSLLARLSRDLETQYQGGCRVVFIDHPTLTANQIVGEITRQLGVGANTTDKLTLLNELRRFLLECHRQQIKCVVILDEGQMLCHRPDLLQELRILLNFCVSDAFLLTFILSGQRPLDETLRGMPEFYQRLPVRFFLRNMDRDDTREMIRHRLHLAGNPAGREIFSEDGYTGIFNYSKGCPRIICSVADLALVIAHSRYSDQVDFVAVSQACSDMSRTDGGYHYFYFLKSFSETAAPQDAAKPPEAKTPQGLVTCLNCGSKASCVVKFCPECGKPMAAGTAADKPEEKSSALKEPLPDRETAQETTELPAEREESKKTDRPGGGAGPDKSTRDIQLELVPPERRREGPGDDLSRRNGLPEAREKRTVFAIENGDKGTEAAEAAGEQAGSSGPPGDPGAAAGMVKCPFCGLILERELEQCPNCAEPLKKSGAGEDGSVPAGAAGESLEKSAEEEPVAGPGPAGDRRKSGREAGTAEEIETLGRRVCPHCGHTSRQESTLCDNCGSPVGSDSPEQVLLQKLEELSFRKYILSENYLQKLREPDPKSEDLLFIPLNRFCGSSAVLRYSNGGSGESFTTRCGLVFTSAMIKFIVAGTERELPYREIEAISVEKLTRNNVVIVYQLVIQAAAGSYRVSLPYRSSTARRMSQLLEQYLSAKVKAVAHVAACRKREAASPGDTESNRARD